MEEIETKIKIVIEMLQSEIAWDYQRYKSSTEDKPINAFVSRNTALDKAKEFIHNEVTKL